VLSWKGHFGQKIFRQIFPRQCEPLDDFEAPHMSYAGVLALYALLQIVWTLLIRTFPNFLGGILLKGVERRNAVAIERVKDELSRNTQLEIERLRADYSTLKSSTDYLSANQAELRSKMIASTERLWSSILWIRKRFGDVIFAERILSPSELDDAFAHGKWPKVTAHLKAYKDEGHVTTKLLEAQKEELDRERLFVGDRLWLIYYTFNAIHFRLGLLVNRSFKESRYVNWRDDKLIQQHVTAVFGAERTQSFRDIATLTATLEAEFLREAMRIMSGSKFLADSITDLQATLLYANERITDDRITE
jgi:hypothetical protein